jgi:hypothetical protein
MTVRRYKIACLLGVACGGLLLGYPGRPASAQAQDEGVQPVENCTVHTMARTVGPGCCNFEPPACDYYIYTYTAWCAGMCPVNQECVGTDSELLITYIYEDCSGSCPDDCDTVESTITWKQVPTGCQCKAEV